MATGATGKGFDQAILPASTPPTRQERAWYLLATAQTRLVDKLQLATQG